MKIINGNKMSVNYFTSGTAANASSPRMKPPEDFTVYREPTRAGDPTKKQQKEDTITNMKYVLFYALSLTVAMAINDVVTTSFSSFPNSKHIISKVTYVVILFGLTIYVAYLLKDQISI